MKLVLLFVAGFCVVSSFAGPLGPVAPLVPTRARDSWWKYNLTHPFTVCNIQKFSGILSREGSSCSSVCVRLHCALTHQYKRESSEAREVILSLDVKRRRRQFLGQPHLLLSPFLSLSPLSFPPSSITVNTIVILTNLSLISSTSRRQDRSSRVRLCFGQRLKAGIPILIYIYTLSLCIRHLVFLYFLCVVLISSTSLNKTPFVAPTLSVTIWRKECRDEGASDEDDCLDKKADAYTWRHGLDEHAFRVVCNRQCRNLRLKGGKGRK